MQNTITYNLNLSGGEYSIGVTGGGSKVISSEKEYTNISVAFEAKTLPAGTYIWNDIISPTYLTNATYRIGFNNNNFRYRWKIYDTLEYYNTVYEEGVNIDKSSRLIYRAINNPTDDILCDDNDNLEVYFFGETQTDSNWGPAGRTGEGFNGNNRLIHIDEDITVESTFYDWFKSNTTSIETIPHITFTINGVTHYATEGMTWKDYCDSIFNDLNAWYVSPYPYYLEEPVFVPGQWLNEISGTHCLVQYNGVNCLQKETIIANGEYTFIKGRGPTPV